MEKVPLTKEEIDVTKGAIAALFDVIGNCQRQIQAMQDLIKNGKDVESEQIKTTDA